MSDERDSSTPNNPTTGDRADGEPAQLGATEIPEDSPATDGDNALSEQVKNRQADRVQDEA